MPDLPRWRGKEPAPSIHYRFAANVKAAGLMTSDLESLGPGTTDRGIDVGTSEVMDDLLAKRLVGNRSRSEARRGAGTDGHILGIAPRDRSYSVSRCHRMS